ncbi:hypothetical protein [Pelagicoccus mobilis]|uniref:Type II toxin-antitoxin system RelE/ParE family toxin n=1 Tax=Pelagicoccus mobilis TaxID=415221 RepID=A0A934RYJ7_9BACT|nr:hypothetical protein [Pelagicoccus mobilis]MBK1876702.1 hypothetical protein [Pelagicoccus mobilis]
MKRFEVTLLDESISDIKAGKRFYENIAEGIGGYFTDSTMGDIASLRLHAGVHPVRFGYHRMLLKRFPFAVYYSTESNLACVVAVLDMRQNPAGIRAILDERDERPNAPSGRGIT